MKRPDKNEVTDFIAFAIFSCLLAWAISGLIEAL